MHFDWLYPPAVTCWKVFHSSRDKTCQGGQWGVLLFLARVLSDFFDKQKAEVSAYLSITDSRSIGKLVNEFRSIHIRTMHKSRTLCIAGCGQIFGDKKLMLRHVRVYHRQFLPTLDSFKCSISKCNREFNRPDNLKRHIEEVHTKQRWRRR